MHAPLVGLCVRYRHGRNACTEFSSIWETFILALPPSLARFSFSLLHAVHWNSETLKCCLPEHWEVCYYLSLSACLLLQWSRLATKLFAQTSKSNCRISLTHIFRRSQIWKLEHQCYTGGMYIYPLSISAKVACLLICSLGSVNQIWTPSGRARGSGQARLGPKSMSFHNSQSQ